MKNSSQSNIKVFNGIPTNKIKGGKASGIIDLDKMGISIPKTYIIPGFIIERTLNLSSVISDLIKFLHDSNENLYSLRCESKDKKNGCVLPVSILNIGVNHEYLENIRKMGEREDYIEIIRSTFINHFSVHMSIVRGRGFINALNLELRDQFFYILSNLCEFLLVNRFPPCKMNIIVQKMIIGKEISKSFSGMCYTRHPYTGEQIDYGKLIFGKIGMALGGIYSSKLVDIACLKQYNPTAYFKIKSVCNQVESYYNDIRYIEYAFNSRKLYFLQNTIGNRTYEI